MDESILILNQLYETYGENQYALSRIKNYMNNLSQQISSEVSTYEKRLHRNNELSSEYDTFCKIFLSKHKYYYLPTYNCFYEYDDKTYKIIKEDDIHYFLLSTITEGGKLVQWKHKTKTHIIKIIKDRHLFTSIPETYTIQSVLGFLQSTLFDTKIYAKYFLTILGDQLLKKTSDTLFLVSQNTKKVLSLIDEISYMMTGSSCINNFITKYHDSHNRSNYRLLKTQDVQISHDVVKELLNKIGIDLLCVAAHYSSRYENAENYLHLNNENEHFFKTHTLFLVNNKQEQIIDTFISQGLTQVDDDSFSVSWKNMHYIWKLHLAQLSVPNTIYSNQLKEILKTKLNYKADSDSFIRVTSKYLPQISIFLQFWEKHIIVSNDLFHEYEIDELNYLFKLNTKNSDHVSEENILKIIQHFFSHNVQIIDNKYISNISSPLRDKQGDITYFLKKKKKPMGDSQLISLDELYQHYQSFMNLNTTISSSMHIRVSKRYFEKYVSHILHTHIHFEKFIDLDWIQS